MIREVLNLVYSSFWLGAGASCSTSVDLVLATLTFPSKTPTYIAQNSKSWIFLNTEFHWLFKNILDFKFWPHINRENAKRVSVKFSLKITKKTWSFHHKFSFANFSNIPLTSYLFESISVFRIATPLKWAISYV